MEKSAKFCLIGQILVDVTLSSGKDESKLRLGGLMHAARAMWALGVKYSIAYVAPAYLVPLVTDFAKHHAADDCICIGEVQGSPNVILIPEPTEAGPQGYELLLRDSQSTEIDNSELGRVVGDTGITDVLIFPGGFDLSTVLDALSVSPTRCHIDAAYDIADLEVCRQLRREFEVVITSTSSSLFLDSYGADPDKMRDAVFAGIGKRLLFKENRGGARLYLSAARQISVGAQLRKIVHSVGVGDCFDVVFTTLRLRHDEQTALSYASFISAEYASTTYPDDFKRAVERSLKIEPGEIIEMEGVRLPWEARVKVQIYIAAPDFDYEDRAPIENVTSALRYHNFQPRRPVLEHGQAKEGDGQIEKSELFRKDLELLNECQILVAVLLHNDPGTLVEIGLAKEKGKAVIIFDPYGIAQNMFLQQIADVLSNSLDEIVAGVFQYSAKLLHETV